MNLSEPNSAHIRLATIDVGTNTVLLLVADVWPNARTMVVYEEQRFARLGEGVDEARNLLPQAMKRVRDALLAYRTICDALNVHSIRVGGTSACRDAKNLDVFRAYLLRETGLLLEVLSGDDEAQWGFQGATAFTENIREDALVMDIGGGSTEIILGNAQSGNLRYRHSFDVGSVRMRERCFHQIPPLPDQRQVADEWLTTSWNEVPFSLNARPLPTFILASGAGMALSLMESGANAFDRSQLTQRILTLKVVSEWFERLLHTAPETLLAMNPAVMHGRSDVFVASIHILFHFMQHFNLPEVHISGGEWRHGWLQSWGQTLLAEPESPKMV